jgi:hypothetical protein
VTDKSVVETPEQAATPEKTDQSPETPLEREDSKEEEAKRKGSAKRRPKKSKSSENEEGSSTGGSSDEEDAVKGDESGEVTCFAFFTCR